MSAEAEQILRDLRDALLTPIPSLSPLRAPGERDIGRLVDILRFMDGNIHLSLVKDLTEMGDPDELARVTAVSTTTEPGREGNARLARNILRNAERSWAAPAPASAAVSVPAVEAVSARDYELESAHAEIARLRAENYDLRAAAAQTVTSVAPASVELAVAEPVTGGTTGERVARLVDSVEDYTVLALSMDTPKRKAMASSLQVLTMRNNDNTPEG